MESLNEETLTKPKQKKPRSEAQQEATKKMLSALDEKKLKLKVLKDKLNNAPPIPEPESEPESEEEEVVAPPKKPVKVSASLTKAEPKSKAPVVEKPKKEPKVVYESASESEEEVVIVKKKKKPKKKTIIYEESEESEEEEVISRAEQPKARETKTQKNKSSFKISAPEVKPAKPQPLYYFAD